MRVWSEKIKLTSQSRRIYCTPVYFMANMGVYSECLNVQGNFIEQRSKLWRRCYWGQYHRRLLNSTCQVCTVLLREYNWIKGWSIQLHTCIFFRLLFFLLSSCNLWVLSSFHLLFVCFSYFIQNVLEDYDDIVVTVGSGGTASGIAIGNYLTGSKLK